MTSFIFMRHGKSQANQDSQIAHDDSPLTKEGEAKARQAGRALRSKGITIVLASPFLRARRTAEIVAKQLKIKDIEIIDDLRERGFGQLKGKPKEHPSEWYYTVDGMFDVEPRGVLIARCESALSVIKKRAQEGTVLVVGHATAGFFLKQVASGKRFVSDFDRPRQLGNAAFETFTINNAPMRTGTKGSWVALAVTVLGVILLVAGIYLKLQPAATPQSVLPAVPLAPEDYNGDPLLQGAVQKLLQDQDQAQQSGSDASGQLQPATNDVPKEW